MRGRGEGAHDKRPPRRASTSFRVGPEEFTPRRRAPAGSQVGASGSASRVLVDRVEYVLELAVLVGGEEPPDLERSQRRLEFDAVAVGNHDRLLPRAEGELDHLRWVRRLRRGLEQVVEVDATQDEQLPGPIVEAAREHLVQREDVATGPLVLPAGAGGRDATRLGKDRLAGDARDQPIERAWDHALAELIPHRRRATQRADDLWPDARRQHRHVDADLVEGAHRTFHLRLDRTGLDPQARIADGGQGRERPLEFSDVRAGRGRATPALTGRDAP